MKICIQKSCNLRHRETKTALSLPDLAELFQTFFSIPLFLLKRHNFENIPFICFLIGRVRFMFKQISIGWKTALYLKAKEKK